MCTRGFTLTSNSKSIVSVADLCQMGPKKTNKQAASPAQSLAKKMKSKYSRKSPGKQDRVRRALYEVEERKISVRKAADKYGLCYGFLRRRLSGEVEIDSRNGPKTVFNTSEEEAIAM